MKKQMLRALLVCLAVLCLTGVALAAEPEELVHVQVEAQVMQEGAVETTVEQKLYDAILEGLLQQKKQINVTGLGFKASSGSALKEAVFEVYLQVCYDHPELIYVMTGMSIDYYSSNYLLANVYPGYYTELMDQTDEFEAAAAEILTTALGKDLGAEMTDLEKALALHDYLVLNCEYDWQVGNDLSDGENSVYTAYGPIVEQDAVCQGYSLAYMYLLEQVGIDAGYVVSTAMGHGWNWVEIGGQRYHVDVTWDDPMYYGSGTIYMADMPGYVSHENFMVDAQTLKGKGHSGFDAVHEYTDTTYTSGYAFCDALVPFVWYEGSFHTVGSDYSVVEVEDLKSAPSLASSVVTLVHDGSIYYYNKAAGGLYRHVLKTGHTVQLEDSQLGVSGFYGLLWNEEKHQVCLVTIKNAREDPDLVAAFDICDKLEWEASGSVVQLAGTLLEEAQIYAVIYDADGRLDQIQVITASVLADEILVDLSALPVPEGGRVNLILLDGEYMPLCAAYKS